MLAARQIQEDSRWDDHELLESEAATSVRTTVENVHEGHWEHVWLLSTGKIADVGVERDALLSRGSLGDSHGDTENGIGTELGLVRCAIELVQEVIHGRLVLDVKVGLDQLWGDLVVDIGDSLGNT